MSSGADHGGSSERLWRVRRRQQSIDALLRKTSDGGLTLEFRLNGRHLTSRPCASRTQAMKAATEKRKELEQAGWATHW
jgi:hypothetical protein